MFHFTQGGTQRNIALVVTHSYDIFTFIRQTYLHPNTNGSYNPVQFTNNGKLSQVYPHHFLCIETFILYTHVLYSNNPKFVSRLCSSFELSDTHISEVLSSLISIIVIETLRVLLKTFTNQSKITSLNRRKECEVGRHSWCAMHIDYATLFKPRFLTSFFCLTLLRRNWPVLFVDHRQIGITLLHSFFPLTAKFVSLTN